MKGLSFSLFSNLSQSIMCEIISLQSILRLLNKIVHSGLLSWEWNNVNQILDAALIEIFVKGRCYRSIEINGRTGLEKKIVTHTLVVSFISGAIS
jgi:hypothetical protein